MAGAGHFLEETSVSHVLGPALSAQQAAQKLQRRRAANLANNESNSIWRPRAFEGLAPRTCVQSDRSLI